MFLLFVIQEIIRPFFPTITDLLCYTYSILKYIGDYTIDLQELIQIEVDSDKDGKDGKDF